MREAHTAGNTGSLKQKKLKSANFDAYETIVLFPLE
jgi:hypothetical protein